MLSDLDPKGKVGRLYGVWDELWGLERRATFLIDHQGIVRYAVVDSLALDGKGVLETLAKRRRDSHR